MVIRKIIYDPHTLENSSVLRTIQSNSYVRQSETGVRRSVATAKWGTFVTAFAGVPNVWYAPYIGPGSAAGTTTFMVLISNRSAGSFRHESDHPAKQFRYYAEYFPNG